MFHIYDRKDMKKVINNLRYSELKIKIKIKLIRRFRNRKMQLLCNLQYYAISDPEY